VVIPQPRPTPTTVATVGTAPTFSLPETGGTEDGIAIGGGVLMVVGLALLLKARRR